MKYASPNKLSISAAECESAYLGSVSIKQFVSRIKAYAASQQFAVSTSAPFVSRLIASPVKQEGCAKLEPPEKNMFTCEQRKSSTGNVLYKRAIQLVTPAVLPKISLSPTIFIGGMSRSTQEVNDPMHNANAKIYFLIFMLIFI